MPSRDDFSSVTKRTLAQRAGGRCSKPGCDKLCWLPGEGPDQAASIGVAAHINAAAPGGKRFDAEQRRVERKSIANAIYLCHDHAHEIDTDEVRFPAEKLRQWKERHEKQVLGEASGTLLFPSFSLIQHSGISVDTTSPTTVSSSGIGTFFRAKACH